MEKVKQQVFSNFNYGIIESIDKRCVDVKCTYNYKGNTLTHYFSYAKSGNKQNSYYIGRAKADMDKLIKNKKAELVAKKDLNGSKATFFKRHKKPILVATTAVLVAGIATAATLITLKYTSNDPTAVTEAEIDKYLEIPTGKVESVGVAAGSLIVKEALKNIGYGGLKNDDPDTPTTNLNKIEIKMISSESYYRDFGRFDYDPEIDPGNESGVNDLTGFYTNDAFKNKQYYSTYISGKFTKDKPTIDIVAKDKLETVKCGSPSFTNITTNDLYTYDKISTGCRPFVETKFNFDGYAAPNLVGYTNLSGEPGMDDKDMENMFVDMVASMAHEFTSFGRLDSAKAYLMRTEDGSVYLANQMEQIFPELTLPSSVIPNKSEPVFVRSRSIWKLKKNPKYGWVLDSYASDGADKKIIFGGTAFPLGSALYVYHNEKGEKIDNGFAINKNKRVVKLSYGDRETTSEKVAAIEYKENKGIVGGNIEVNSNYYNSSGGEQNVSAKSMTLIHRIEDHNFDGYDYEIDAFDSNTGVVSADDKGLIAAVTNYESDTTKYYGYNEILEWVKDTPVADLIEKGDEIDIEGKKYNLCKFTKADGWYSLRFVFDNKNTLSGININYVPGVYPGDSTK